MLNVAFFLDGTAARQPHAKALVYEGHSFDFAQIRVLANQVANGLRAAGYGPGSRIALACGNRPGFLAAYYGILKIGGLAVVLSTTLRERDIRFQLEDSGAEALLTYDGPGRAGGGNDFGEGALAAAEAAPACRQAWVIPADITAASPLAGAPALRDLMAGQPDAARTHGYAADDTAVLLYTSGSTGRPKGVELTQVNLLAMTRINQALAPRASTRVRLISTPLFHVMGQVCGLNLAMLNGETLVLVEGFDPALIWRLIVEQHVSYFVHMPIYYQYLMERADGVDTAAVRSCLRLCATGGAPLQAGLSEAFAERFGLPIVPGYGLTEASSIVAWGGTRDGGSVLSGRGLRPTTVGPAVPGVEVALEADGALSALPGAQGEILLRGPGVMKGYLNLPEVTARTLRGGWLRTGDIGRFDEAGRLDILGRADDKILRGEEHIYPAEVEAVLKAHPAVAEAAVIGVPDDYLGQEAKTFVVLRDGCSLAAEDLLGWLARELPDGKCPGLVEFQAALPLTPTGKVARHLLT
ncbi:class I adenylate-forming enzyme family protein [Pelagibius marinus]|uniref:class I adenylate-forming enzyme family protein n=1 Tax=Pelagibius marinus TaxID=2762760 RepID=UPI0018731D09|nr:AMP-binding protein [Pelagibius marinus]